MRPIQGCFRAYTGDQRMRRVTDHDEEGKGPGDQEDPGAKGPRDEGTRGPEDHRIRGTLNEVPALIADPVCLMIFV